MARAEIVPRLGKPSQGPGVGAPDSRGSAWPAPGPRHRLDIYQEAPDIQMSGASWYGYRGCLKRLKGAPKRALLGAVTALRAGKAPRVQKGQFGARNAMPGIGARLHAAKAAWGEPEVPPLRGGKRQEARKGRPPHLRKPRQPSLTACANWPPRCPR